jgi:type 1 fimbriae regulatory protein FimE
MRLRTSPEETFVNLLPCSCREILRAVFPNERGGKLSTGVVKKIVTRAGEMAGTRNCHPHQLRHACGYFLASKGFDTKAIQDYLGHQSILHTVRYTELAPDRFKDFWQD